MGTNRAPDRYASIGPVFQLLRALRDWRTLDEMAAELRVHRRTIQRILDALRTADIDVVERRRSGDGMTPTEYRVTRIGGVTHEWPPSSSRRSAVDVRS